MKTFNVSESIKVQAALCKEKCYPHFAPSSGNCYNCHENIYTEKEVTHGDRTHSVGISVEKATNELITGCPFCHRSYCD